MLRKKKKEFNDATLKTLLSSIDNQIDFWNNIKKISFKSKQPENNISVDTWFEHFKTLLTTHVSSNSDGIVQIEGSEEEDADYLNRPISKEEVVLAIRKIKNGKAAGPDGIIGELLKYGYKNDSILSFLVSFFNILFDKGIFPENWSESIILPLYKKGKINAPGNYRGISLCDVMSKVYSSIINARLQDWVETNNITGEYQAGFKRNYSTVDHMFTLMSFVQKQFFLKRKLYVAFIDFEKAFDSVNRTIL